MKTASINLTWWGVSAGGEHYTAKCYVDGEFYETTYKLTAFQAKALNKKSGESYAIYFKGDECRRFFSRTEAVFESVKLILKKNKEVEIIGIGSLGTVLINPSEIAYCRDQHLFVKLNRLYRDYENAYNDYEKALKNLTSSPGVAKEAKIKILELEAQWDEIYNGIN